MKYFVLLFSVLFFFTATAFGNTVGEKACTRPPKIEFLDYINLEAMHAKSRIGKVLLDYLEQDLRTSPDTRVLTQKAALIYGNGFLNTIREFISAKVVSSDGTCSMGFACIVSNPRLTLPPFPQAESVNIDGKTFFKLPPELVHLFPEHFLKKTPSVFARNSEKALILIACNDSEKACLAEKFSGLRADTEKYKKIPGLLIYRQFPRRELRDTGKKTLCPAIPSGEFQLSENAGEIRLFAVFHCKDVEENAHMKLFFTQFKSSLHNAANEATTPETRKALKAVADSLEISSVGMNLEIRIHCSPEEFPAFFEWRNARTGL